MQQNKYIVDGKKTDITKANWDILVILDACRYDIFKQVYKEIIPNGKLKKAISPATWTLEWLSKTWTEYYEDIIYLSSIPFINSKKKSKGNLISRKEWEFDAKKHFSKIIDVWNLGWSEQYSTIHPKEVNKYAIASMDVHRKNKFVLHYAQPHEPYIYYNKKNNKVREWWREEKTNKFKHRLLSLGQNLIKYIPNELFWNVGNILNQNFGLSIPLGKGDIYIKHGRKGIIKGYTEDLKLALNYVKRIANMYPKKKILITADHGERLGEKGRYGHGGDRRPRELVEVPWFEIDNN